MVDKTLRKKLIRLAYEKPELRDVLLPLVSDPRTAAGPLRFYVEELEEGLDMGDEFATREFFGDFVQSLDRLAHKAGMRELSGLLKNVRRMV